MWLGLPESMLLVVTAPGSFEQCPQHYQSEHLEFQAVFYIRAQIQHLVLQSTHWWKLWHRPIICRSTSNNDNNRNYKFPVRGLGVYVNNCWTSFSKKHH
jgi:hypothetical protein